MVSKINKCLLVVTSIAFMTSLVVSCNKEELSPLKIVFDIESENIVDALYSANGETIQFSLNLDREASTSGLSVTQIEVFLNNIKIAENFNSEHLDISYQLKKKTIGKNPLRITFKATAPGYQETVAHVNMEVLVMPEKPIYGYELVADDLWINNNTVNLSLKEKESATLHFNCTKVIYAIDDSIIGQTDSADGSYIFQAAGLSPGQHNLYAIISSTIPEDNFSCNLAITKIITVQ